MLPSSFVPEPHTLSSPQYPNRRTRELPRYPMTASASSRPITASPTSSNHSLSLPVHPLQLRAKSLVSCTSFGQPYQRHTPHLHHFLDYTPTSEASSSLLSGSNIFFLTLTAMRWVVQIRGDRRIEGVETVSTIFCRQIKRPYLVGVRF